MTHRRPDAIAGVLVLLVCAFFLGRCYAECTLERAAELGDGPAEAFP